MKRFHDQGSAVVVTLRLFVLSTLLLLAAMLLGAPRSGRTAYAQLPRQSTASSIAFLTDDIPVKGYEGCDAIAVYDVSARSPVYYGDQHVSPGQLTVTQDGSLAISVSNDSFFTYMIRRSITDVGQWSTFRIDDSRKPAKLQYGGAPAITPNGEILLLPSVDGIEKYSVAAITDENLGPILGIARTPGAAAIEVSADSKTAYVVAVDRNVYIVDIDLMTVHGAPIEFEYPPSTSPLRLRRMFATLSPTGEYLVVNTLSGSVNVVDLQKRTSVVLPLEGLNQSWAVRFNYVGPNSGLLAVHGRNRIGVFEFNGTAPMIRKARIEVPSQTLGDPTGLFPRRVNALSWTSDGDQIIAAVQSNWLDWRVLNYDPQSQDGLTIAYDFASCTLDRRVDGDKSSASMDVRTLNGLGLNATPTPSSMPPSTLTSTPSPTASPTVTPSPSTTITPSGTPSSTATPTPRPTRIPGPIYLPLLLKESCTPGTRRMDVLLVMDSSSSMLEPTAAGRTKLAAAVDAARSFLDQLHFGSGDQAAIVSFNAEASLLAQLTADSSVLDASLAGINTAQYTRIDRGITVARDELASSRHRSDNTPVMIVLTDGRANPVPVSVAEDEARTAKAAGVVVFTIGLGTDLDIEALRSMATRPEYFYTAPDAEALAGIYRGIAVAIPCPAAAFWGRR